MYTFHFSRICQSSKEREDFPYLLNMVYELESKTIKHHMHKQMQLKIKTEFIQELYVNQLTLKISLKQIYA